MSKIIYLLKKIVVNYRLHYLLVFFCSYIIILTLIWTIIYIFLYFHTSLQHACNFFKYLSINLTFVF